MFRVIDIGQLVYQTLRSNYSLAREYQTLPSGEVKFVRYLLSKMYTILLACFWSLSASWARYDFIRYKSRAVAIAYAQAQVLWVLNKYYGQYGQIRLKGVEEYYLYLENDLSAPKKYWSNTTPIYLTNSDVNTNTITIMIPLALQNSPVYEDFYADLYAMIMYGINIIILTY